MCRDTGSDRLLRFLRCSNSFMNDVGDDDDDVIRDGDVNDAHVKSHTSRDECIF